MQGHMKHKQVYIIYRKTLSKHFHRHIDNKHTNQIQNKHSTDQLTANAYNTVNY